MIEAWMWEILNEDQKEKVREILFSRICDQMHKVEFERLTLDEFVIDCADKLDYDRLASALQTNIEKTLKTVKIDYTGISSGIEDALKEALESADTGEIGASLVKKIVRSIDD